MVLNRGAYSAKKSPIERYEFTIYQMDDFGGFDGCLGIDDLDTMCSKTDTLLETFRYTQSPSDTESVKDQEVDQKEDPQVESSFSADIPLSFEVPTKPNNSIEIRKSKRTKTMPIVQSPSPSEESTSSSGKPKRKFTTRTQAWNHLFNRGKKRNDPSFIPYAETKDGMEPTKEMQECNMLFDANLEKWRKQVRAWNKSEANCTTLVRGNALKRRTLEIDEEEDARIQPLQTMTTHVVPVQWFAASAARSKSRTELAAIKLRLEQEHSKRIFTELIAKVCK